MFSAAYQDARYGQNRPKKQSWGGMIALLLIIVLVRTFFFATFRIPSGSMIPTLKVGDFIVSSKMSYGWSSYSVPFGGYLHYYTGLFMDKVGDRALPQRGDVVVFGYPHDVRTDYIKRVIGVPGDRVQMIRGRLHLNGTMVPLEKLEDAYKDYQGPDETGHHRHCQGTVYKATLPRPDGTSVDYKILKQIPFQEIEKGTAMTDTPQDTPEYTVPQDHVFCMGDNWDGSSDSRIMEKLGFVHRRYLLGRAYFIFLSLDYEHISLWKPWTWLMIPFKIRYSRCLYKKI